MSLLMGRHRFFFNLGALAGAVLLIIAAAAFGPGAVKGVGLGIGVACGVFSLWFVAELVHRRHLDGYIEFQIFGRGVGIWSVLASIMAAVAIWEIVQAAVFEPEVSRWLTLANGLVMVLLSLGGLVAHEVCTERVVHVLEIVERP
jgi:hypothetical protein